MIATEGVGVAFGEHRALDDVSFTLPDAVLVGVLGPNGAGKTTLLRALLGTVPATGTVRLSGPAAHVPQLGDAQTAFPVDAVGVVLMGRYPALGWWRRPGAGDRRRALELLDRVGLADRARVPFGALSGGQRQRALVARALAQEGEVLLLDEPHAGLDADGRDLLDSLVADAAAQGKTVVLASHELDRATALAGRTVVVAGGQAQPPQVREVAGVA